MRHLATATTALLLIGCSAQAEVAASPALLASSADTAAIEQLDADIFEAAFLTCDGDRLREIMADDLEFYHDKYGIIARTNDEFVDGTIPDCLKRQAGELPYLERRANEGTMVVRKIGDDALMQTGSHSFWLQPPGEDILKVETGVYTHIWVREGDSFKISRVISYDHVDQ